MYMYAYHVRVFNKLERGAMDIDPIFYNFLIIMSLKIISPYGSTVDRLFHQTHMHTPTTRSKHWFTTTHTW